MFPFNANKCTTNIYIATLNFITENDCKAVNLMAWPTFLLTNLLSGFLSKPNTPAAAPKNKKTLKCTIFAAITANGLPHCCTY